MAAHIAEEDATWILTGSFIIFTMQSGFSLLESGLVSKKNELNVMLMNVADVVFGGLGYWTFGYGLSFGTGPGSNPFVGLGSWFLDSSQDSMGVVYDTFVFQMSFAALCGTIVSGAIAERCRYIAYCVYSFLQTVTYCLPVRWLWTSEGVLRNLGAVDVAGCCTVHLVGGVASLVAVCLLGRRNERPVCMASPTNALMGTFMLWWGWLGVNCGSTFGVSGDKWKLAAKAAIVTVNASVGGVLTAFFVSYIMYEGKLPIICLINGLLASLVSITGGCYLYEPWEAMLIGAIGSLLANTTRPILSRAGCDDTIGVVAVHGFGAIWGMTAVGLFAHPTSVEQSRQARGVFWGGGFNLLLVQTVSLLAVSTWTAVLTFVFFKGMDLFGVRIRISPEQEKLGMDLSEHGLLVQQPQIEWLPVGEGTLSGIFLTPSQHRPSSSSTIEVAAIVD